MTNVCGILDNSSTSGEMAIIEIQQNLKQNAKSADIIVMTVFLSLIALVGVLGNFLVLSVYKNQQDKQSTNHFIFVMASCDLFACLVIIPYRISSYHMLLDLYVCKIMEGLTYFTLIFSVFMLMIISVDRFLAVAQPLKYNQIKSKAVYVSVTAALAGLVIATPAGVIMGRFIYNNSSSCTDPIYTGVCHGSGEDSRFISDRGRKLYSICLFILYGLLVIIVAIMYSNVFYRVYKRRKMRVASKSNILALQSIASQTEMRSETNVKPTLDNDPLSTPAAPGNAAKENNTKATSGINKGRPRSTHGRTARMLLLVTLMFVFTWFPFLLIKVQLIPNIVSVRLSFFLSSMCNPVIYSFTNVHFRNQAKKQLNKLRIFHFKFQ